MSRYPKSKKPNLSNCFIELYAGAGGSILGFINAGMKCLAAVERDIGACWTLWHNLCLNGWTHFKVQPELLEKQKKVMGDRQETENTLFVIPEDNWTYAKDEPSPILQLWNYDMLELEPEWLMESLGIKPKELGIISGGPPCQGFSVANSNRSMTDIRNQHPARFLYFIKVIQPKMFFMENVPGMLSLGKKKGDTEGPFPIALRKMANEYGYELTYSIHNAMNYGVPQSRKRVLFVGIRKDLYTEGVRFTMSEPTHTWSYFDALKDGTLIEKVKSGKQCYVTVLEAIGDLNKWALSSSRDSDCKNLPDGHRERRGGGRNRKTDDAESELRDDGYIWYQDRFSGNWFRGNHYADYSFLKGKGDDNYLPHTMSCRCCQKFNLIARPNCHYCNFPLYPSLIDCI